MEYITAGESHGPKLTAIVSGVPAGLEIDIDRINDDLARRQSGYGRGGRQKIERDTATVTSGVRFGRTTGAPIAIEVENRDWQNWTDRMAQFGDAPADLKREVQPRPGHADLVGVMRNDTDDCRDILERSSARETAARVAACGVAKELLRALGVEVLSYVVSIGDVSIVDAEDSSDKAVPHMIEDADGPSDDIVTAPIRLADLAAFEQDAADAPSATQIKAAIESSVTRCPDTAATERMKAAIDEAKQQGESLGGTFRVIAAGAVPGLGSYTSGPERLTSRLAAAICSIPAIKGVEFGIGFEAARRPGSQVHDEIALCASNSGAGISNPGCGVSGTDSRVPITNMGSHETGGRASGDHKIDASAPGQTITGFGSVTDNTGDSAHAPAFARITNNAGGLEGGMSTGAPIIVTAAMKPIPTLMTPLKTINLDTLEPAEASRERSDTCAVPAAAVVAEGEVAMVLANACLEAFGCTSMTDLKANIGAYRKRLSQYADAAKQRSASAVD